MPKVYNGLQSSFVSLAWPWSGRYLPKGNQWECWDPGLGPNVVQLPVLPPYDQTQSLTGWYFITWLVGWPIAAGNLAGWLTAYQTKMSTLPPKEETSCGHVCDDLGHIDQMYHPPVDISWPNLVLLWAGYTSVRCTPHMRLQARFALSQMSSQVN